MTALCGCRSCSESDEMVLAEMAEHQADFDRYLSQHDDSRPAVPGDYETGARTRLALLAARDGWPVAVVRRVP